MHQFSLPVSAWTAWAPGLQDHQDWGAWAVGRQAAEQAGDPALPGVEPMLRRRLSRLNRMAIHVAQDSLSNRASASIVYASRHGDLARTLKMLDDIAEGEMPSPTAFSLSVHNAGMGVLSILKHLYGQATAISAGAESFGYGLLEALARLQACPEQPVLYVYAEDTLPDLYAGGQPQPHFPHAVSVLLEPAAPIRLLMRIEPDAVQDDAGTDQSLAFMRALCGTEASVAWQGQQRWIWSCPQ